MNKSLKFTAAAIAKLKHPVGSTPTKWYDKNLEGLCVKVMPQPSLKISYYAHWSTITFDKDGKQKRSGRYKYLGRVGGSKNLEAIKIEVVNNLSIWKAGNVTGSSVKTVGSLNKEYKKDGGATGFRIKLKGSKITYKSKTSSSYTGLIDAYVMGITKKESLKQMLTAPYKLGDNSYYKKILADIPLDKLTKKDVEIWHSKLAAVPIAANRALAVLSTVFEWDSKRSTPAYKGFNPCLRIAKYPEVKDKRYIDTIEKVLDVNKYLEEQLWREPHFNTYYRLQMEYGERLEDTQGIAWEKPHSLAKQKECRGWIDWRKKEIYLTDTKNREDADCELTAEMIVILKKLQNLISDENSNASWAVGSMWVFPRPTDPTKHINNSSYRCKLRDFNFKMGFATREHIRGTGKRKVYKYTNLLTMKHLRKTFVTYYGRQKGLEAASLRMRHSSLKVTKEHYFNEEEAALKTGSSIYETATNVVPLKKVADDK